MANVHGNFTECRPTVQLPEMAPLFQLFLSLAILIICLREVFLCAGNRAFINLIFSASCAGGSPLIRKVIPSAKFFWKTTGLWIVQGIQIIHVQIKRHPPVFCKCCQRQVNCVHSEQKGIWGHGPSHRDGEQKWSVLEHKAHFLEWTTSWFSSHPLENHRHLLHDLRLSVCERVLKLGCPWELLVPHFTGFFSGVFLGIAEQMNTQFTRHVLK